MREEVRLLGMLCAPSPRDAELLTLLCSALHRSTYEPLLRERKPSFLTRLQRLTMDSTTKWRCLAAPPSKRAIGRLSRTSSARSSRRSSHSRDSYAVGTLYMLLPLTFVTGNEQGGSSQDVCIQPLQAAHHQGQDCGRHTHYCLPKRPLDVSLLNGHL